MTLKNKVVIITGASSGIGEAAALAFAKGGYHVSLAARNLEKLEEVATACREFGVKAITLKCDVSKEEDCKHLINETLKQLGAIDVLINNAGISMRAVFAELDLSVIKQVMGINYWGTVYCTYYAIPHLLKAKGSVVGISSIAGYMGLPGRTGYSSSKFAMKGFLDALRSENRKTGLHVGVVSPGYTASNIRNTALNKEAKAQTETPYDESKLMSAEAVADEIVNCVGKRKREVVLTLQGKLAVLLNKFLPNFADKLVYNKIRKEKDSPFK